MTTHREQHQRTRGQGLGGQDVIVSGSSSAPSARRLDTTEGIFWVYEQHGAFRAAHTAVIEGELSEELLQQALLRLQARQPKLRMLIRGGVSELQFVQTSIAATVAWVRRGVPQAQWAREAERELNGPGFPADALPWRVGLLLGSAPQGPHAVVLVLHHSLTDGLGTLRILNDLLRSCAEVAAGTVEPPPEPPEAPTLDACLAEGTGRRELLRHRARNVLQRFSKQKAQLLPFEGVAMPSERRTGVLLRDVEPEIFRALHRRAREARVSINGVLTVLALDAVHSILGVRGELAVSTQVSLRTRCRPQILPAHVGVYVSNVVTRHALEDRRGLWERAAEIAEAVQRPLEARTPQIALRAGRGRLAALERSVAMQVADAQSQGRVGALSLSNRGPVPVEDAGPFVLRALYSPAGVHAVGPCLQLSFGTVCDRLCCTFSYPRPLLRERTVNAIAHALTTRIIAAADAGTQERRAS